MSETTDNRLSIAELVKISERRAARLSRLEGDGGLDTYALAEAVPVLLEITAAVLALREQELAATRMRSEFARHDGRSILDAMLIEAANTEIRLDVCRNAVDTALAKVRP